MTRKSQLGPKSVINSTGLSTNLNGEQSVCEFVDRVIYDITWSAGSSLNATMKIQKSHDAVTWYDLDLINPLALTGASGSETVIIKEITYKYIRPIITFVAGSCTLLTIVKGVSEGN